MFSTWFRIHTIALIAQVLTDEPIINDCRFKFNSALSMGWHRPWDIERHRVSIYDRAQELGLSLGNTAFGAVRKTRRIVGRAVKRLLRVRTT